jgi:SagB-type dehydrogenase family enzyme
MTETRLCLRPGISLVDGPDGAQLQTAAGAITVPGPLGPLLHVLAEGRSSEEALYALARATDGALGAARLQVALVQYARLGFLRHTLVGDGVALAALETFGGERVFSVPVGLLHADKAYRLSRFAVCRRQENEMVLESPLSRVRLTLGAATTATIVALLTVPRTVDEISRCCLALSQAASRALVEWLVAAKLVGIADEQGEVDHDQPASSWSVDELLFHARSRTGLYGSQAGATFRFRNSIPPLQARKAPMSAAIIDLPRPDGETHPGSGRPFWEVAWQKRDAAAPGGRPVDLRQLGELLYRAARVRAVRGVDPSAGRLYEATSRPYPNGGAIYDIELYVIARSCAGLPEGLYHYDPFAHGLERLSGANAHTNARLIDSARAAGLSESPSVLIAMASRFQRRSWKYEGIAYANGLKGVGVLQETMMLVATEMNLDAHAIGAHDDGSFAAATGLDPEVEGLLGELLLAGGSGMAA